MVVILISSPDSVVTAVYDPLNSICCMFSVFAWWKRGRLRMVDCAGET